MIYINKLLGELHGIMPCFAVACCTCSLQWQSVYGIQVVLCTPASKWCYSHLHVCLLVYSMPYQDAALIVSKVGCLAVRYVDAAYCPALSAAYDWKHKGHAAWCFYVMLCNVCVL